MIYLIGGAPRVGKSTLCQQFARRMGIGWVSTDVVLDLLWLANVAGIKREWDATPSAVTQSAEWFFPYLQRLVWGTSSMAEAYVIEGVHFLPEHVKRLSQEHNVQAVFLGHQEQTLENLDRHPGQSRGYQGLPENLRQQIADDVPKWSQFVRGECSRYGCKYIDTSGDFAAHLNQAEAFLLGG